MLRRPDRARRGRNTGASHGALFSPFVSQTKKVRRRTPALTLVFSVIFLLAAAGGAAAVVASAIDTSSGGGPRKAVSASAVASRGSGAARQKPIVRPSPRRQGPRSVVETPEQAIDRVLAYTPFVRGGVPRKRVIALTFDDGPGPYTSRLVRVLVKLHAAATFFIVGQELQYFSAGLRDELQHGFVIGDHTENHRPLDVLAPPLQYFQIHEDALLMSRLGAPFPRLFRPPYGVYNTRTFGILSQLHMLMVLWSVDPKDWLRPGTSMIVKRVLEAARPGAIVELHDGGGDRSETVAALPAIITSLRRRHYQLVTVPELIAVDPPPHHQQLPRLSE